MDYSNNLNVVRTLAVLSSKEKSVEFGSGVRAQLSKHLFTIHFSFTISAEDISALGPNTAKRPAKNQYSIFSPSQSPSYCLQVSWYTLYLQFACKLFFSSSHFLFFLRVWVLYNRPYNTDYLSSVIKENKSFNYYLIHEIFMMQVKIIMSYSKSFISIQILSLLFLIIIRSHKFEISILLFIPKFQIPLSSSTASPTRLQT